MPDLVIGDLLVRLTKIAAASQNEDSSSISGHWYLKPMFIMYITKHVVSSSDHARCVYLQVVLRLRGPSPNSLNSVAYV